MRGSATMSVERRGFYLTVRMVFALLIAGCGADGARSAGTPCTPETCGANLCYDEVCLDPASNEDDDRLTLSEEVALQTSPYVPDTDEDATLDGIEVVHPDNPRDEDGDGVHDALESRVTDQDGDCLTDQRDPDDTEPELDPTQLAELGCCCYGPCSAWDIDAESATCEVAEDGTKHLVCPPNIQPDSDQDGVADPCDLCPYDPDNTCDGAPHSLASDPPSPASETSPTITGHAFGAQSVSLHAITCEGETVLAESVPVDTQGRFAAAVQVTEDATTTLVARAQRIGDNTSGPSAPPRLHAPR